MACGKEEMQIKAPEGVIVEIDHRTNAWEYPEVIP